MTQSTSKTAAKTVLVIGITGSFGGHTAQALLKRGWQIRALARNPQAAARKAGPRTPIEWIEGDAMNPADVMAAAEGVSVIVHGANPPGYRNWRGLAIPMLRATIAAAEHNGARIVFPGNVYNFAPDSGAHVAEDAPQAPVTRKGKIRVEMETMLRIASARGAKVLVVRAGDYLGPAAPNSALGWQTTRSRGRLTSVYAVGPGEVGHAFAYLPDLAETTARLLDREAELADFDVFHFGGHWLDRADELAASIRRVTAQPKLPIRPFPWAMVYGLSPFVETFRELIEMRYLQRRPIGLDNAKLVAFLGAEPQTTLDAAIRATLSDMGCLPEPEETHSMVGARA
ncbi:MAG TPA: NAD-dependent epimerase/dehydratase family protein [Caulobacteraceae bacterium]|jgi:nucleoside-diphosphate-sugar epimerase